MTRFLLAAGVFGAEISRQQVLALVVTACAGAGLFFVLVGLSRSLRRREVRGAGLLLFAALVYLPLLGTYVSLGILGFNDQVLNPVQVEEGLPARLEALAHADALLFLIVVLGVYLVVTFLDAVLFTREREEMHGLKVPRILREMLRWLLVAGSAVFSAAAIWDLQIQNLTIITSAVGIAASLAMGPTLGSLVSGIMLAVDRPFELGDWIEVDGKQGRVDQITWRSTRIVTRDHESVVLPNSRLAEGRIINISRPDSKLRIRVRVGVHYRTPPLAAREALRRAVAGTPGVLERPEPLFRVLEFGDHAVHWEILFWIDAPEAMENIRADVLQRVWYSLDREGIEIPYPIRNLVMREKGWENLPSPSIAEVEVLRRRNADLLRRIPIFAGLPEADLAYIASRAPDAVFLDGERVTRQGDPGDRMYVILRGIVRVVVEARGPRVLAELKEGDCFGEMSLLTGCPRVATVVAVGDLRVISLKAEDLKPVLEKHPEFARNMAEFAASRMIRLEELTTAVEARGPSVDLQSTSTNLLQEILRYFKLPGGRGGPPGGDAGRT